MGALEVYWVDSFDVSLSAIEIGSSSDRAMPVVILENSLRTDAPNLGYVLSETSLDVRG